jgi:hypothetical protein
MERRNFKAMERPALLYALGAWPWSDVYGIRDPDKVLDFVTKGMVNGLDRAAPVKSITVREGSLPLYLHPDTLALMAKRDSLGRGPRYRVARNRVTVMVRRDKEASNLAKLTESGNSPAVLWEIANAAVGKPRQPLPTSVTRADGTQTEGNLEAANTINAYYVQKVLRIRTGRGVQNTSQETSTTSRDGDRRGKNTFAFGFASAGRIAKIFSGQMSTSALGTDGILVSVLKMGSNMLAGPVSNLVNMSLSAGLFPLAFKTALIHPVYKGGGKARNNPWVVQASGHPLRPIQGARVRGQGGPGGLLEGAQHLAHVAARLQKGEVMYHCTRDSPRGLARGQGEGEGGGCGRV